ncbi:stromal cell-derived factor 2 [Stomoxys calcitrans]|uniref:MIR domain-containing protein n=1 Tax=Stomoxys calcitrans TaxID=35570 RepID=A0A1I8NPT5_STOCA|nr:stromal cell-derived factor 2 [Stomoxys calcitrans]
MKYKGNRILLVTLLAVLCKIQTAFAAKKNFVTCGSIVKLLNTDYSMRLHSHDVKYGSGSGQQSVTAIELKEDVNSHWTIKAATNKYCERGEPVKCGDIIRLEHLSTHKNLHSHFFSSPLSGEQEVSAYGENGVGDSGDHWELICSNDSWMRDAQVRFRHVDTGAYLSISGRTFGRPISGQMEVVGMNNPQHGTRWTTAEGLFIVPKEKETEYIHTEL